MIERKQIKGLPCFDIAGMDGWREYKECVPKELRVNRNDVENMYKVQKHHRGRDYYIRLSRTYTRVIAESMLEYEGGVVVEDGFYMFNYMHPKYNPYRKRRRKNKVVAPDRNNPYQFAQAVMFPEGFSHWVFIRDSYCAHYRLRFKRNLLNAVRYKAYYDDLKEGFMKTAKNLFGGKIKVDIPKDKIVSKKTKKTKNKKTVSKE